MLKYQESSQFKVDNSNLNPMEFENIIQHLKLNTDYAIIENYTLKKEILSIVNIIESELKYK